MTKSGLIEKYSNPNTNYLFNYKITGIIIIILLIILIAVFFFKS